MVGCQNISINLCWAAVLPTLRTNDVDGNRSNKNAGANDEVHFSEEYTFL